MLKKITQRNNSMARTGRSQEARILPALDANYVKLYREDLGAYVQFLKAMGPLLTFYNDEDQAQGTWGEFLGKDLAIRIIELQAFDPDALAEEFGEIMQVVKWGGDRNVVEEAAFQGLQAMLRMLLRVEDLRLVSQTLPAFQNEILSLIREKFGPIRQRFLAQLREKFEGRKEGRSILEKGERNFGDVWDLENDDGTVPLPDPDFEQLPRLFNQLVDFLRLLKAAGQRYLGELLDSGQVSPHIALLFTFNKLMGRAGNELNDFTARHLEHYYRKVLQLEEKPGSPDQIHVVFRLAQNAKGLHLPVGTELDAGEDALGKQLAYRLDRSIQLSHTRLTDIKAVIHDESCPDFELFEHSELEVEAFFVNSEELESEAKLKDCYQMFLPGLAIADPILHLDPANSLLKFRFHFDNDSFLGFRDRIFEAASPSYQTKYGEPELSYKILKVNQLIGDLMVVDYTTEEGEWARVHTENVEFKLVSSGDRLTFNVLDLEILFNPADPPIQPCLSEKYPQASASEVPLFKFSLNPSKLHLYYTLVDLILNQIQIDVNVLGLGSLILQNDYGLLDPDTPFQPFGPLADIGSSFYIGHPRIFNQSLTKVNLKIEWFEVPTEQGGFAEYYKDYVGIEDNGDFKVGVSILDQKQWKPRTDRQVIDLFETLDEGNETGQRRVSRIRQVTDLEMELLEMKSNSGRREITMYNHETLTGFMRLELLSPQVGFGHRQYPEVIGRTSMEGMLKKKFIPPPNRPFNPAVKSISLDYSASCTINFHKMDQESHQWIYHLHPFGVDFLNPEFGFSRQYFLTRYGLGSHLMMGLEDYEAGRELSLLFEINEGGALEYARPLEVTWAYLKGDLWRRVQMEEILYDTTNGMTQTGLIRMVLPELSKQEAEILPPGKTWLRCCSPLGNDFLQNILDVHCQAASATFVDRENDPAHYQQALPSGSIKGMLPGNVNVAEVLQPHPSFGGRPPEEGLDFLKRTSERLRHKDRAVSAWDCETLVLEAFPQIQKVICLSHLSLDYETAPGEILLIVIPRVSKKDREMKRIPRVGPSILNAIQEHVQRRTFAFARVHVRNPALEYVRINMRVKFQKGYDDVTYYKNKLNEDIFQLLMPWLYDVDAEIKPGQVIFAAQVIRFLDSRDYIDYISNFSLYHFVEGKLLPPSKDSAAKQKARPRAPGALMLSVPQHHFELIQDDGAPLEGIGLSATGLDFSIPASEEQYEEGIERIIIEKDFQIPEEDSTPRENISINIKWN